MCVCVCASETPAPRIRVQQSPAERSAPVASSNIFVYVCAPARERERDLYIIVYYSSLVGLLCHTHYLIRAHTHKTNLLFSSLDASRSVCGACLRTTKRLDISENCRSTHVFLIGTACQPIVIPLLSKWTIRSS
jgi:hypothetical protein